MLLSIIYYISYLSKGLSEVKDEALFLLGNEKNNVIVNYLFIKLFI